MIDFDAEREVVTPKDAATLLVVRDASEGLEIFCVRRHAASAFMGGAVVFPGGKLDAADAHCGPQARGIHERATRFADGPEHALALSVCACREALEEAALLPTGSPLEDLEILRRQWEASDEPFAAFLAEHSLQLATDALVPFARWITPKAEKRRYDARFFLTELSAGQRGRHDARETTSSVWATPRRMLEAFARGEISLAPPTLRAFELLDEAPTVAEAMARCRSQSLAPICPRFVPGDPPMLVIPGDPEHPEAERCVSGPTRFVLRDGKFVSEEP